MGNICCCCLYAEEAEQPVLKVQEQFGIDNDFPFIVIGNHAPTSSGHRS